MGIGHLPGERLVPVVEPRAHAGLLERMERAPGMRAPSLEARHQDLLGREPGREPTPVLLENDAEKSLEAAQKRTVKDDRSVPPARAVRKREVEALGQHEVDLDRPALPCPAEAIAKNKLELRAVEGAFSGLLAPVQPRGPRRVDEQPLGPVPDRIVAQPRRGPPRERDLDVVESERRVERAQAPDEEGELGGDLVLPAEHVPVVLDELTEAEEPVERARRLVPVHEPELGDAQRQLTPQRRQPSDELHVARTADGLQRPGLALQHEHAVAEHAPVAAAFPDILGEDLRATHLAVALPEDDPTEVVLEREDELKPARVPEHTPGGLFLEVEEPEAVAESPVIIVMQHGSDSEAEARVTGRTRMRASSTGAPPESRRDGDDVLEGVRPPTRARRSDPPRGWWSLWRW